MPSERGCDVFALDADTWLTVVDIAVCYLMGFYVIGPLAAGDELPLITWLREWRHRYVRPRR